MNHDDESTNPDLPSLVTKKLTQHELDQAHLAHERAKKLPVATSQDPTVTSIINTSHLMTLCQAKGKEDALRSMAKEEMKTDEDHNQPTVITQDKGRHIEPKVDLYQNEKINHDLRLQAKRLHTRLVLGGATLMLLVLAMMLMSRLV